MTDKYVERFWDNVIVKPNECWEWWGGVNDDGYGNFSSESGHIAAHRFAYITNKGQIPQGMILDHLCRNPSCVNPDHLEPVTTKENLMRSPKAPAAINARKTHCPLGHEFDYKNTGLRPNGNRRCRACECIRTRDYRKRLKSRREAGIL